MEQDVRVVMVDARQGFLDAVALVLSEHRTLRLVGSASTVGEALTHGLPGRCDVVAMGLDDTNDVGALEQLCRECPSLGIVVMSATSGEVHLPDALGWGVRGWVSRNDGVNDLLDALVDVAAGEAHLPAEPLNAMFAAVLRERPDVVPVGSRPLTGRESAVLDCLASGMTRHDIGVALELSDNTVRTYVRRILRKLHVHSASAAVAMTRGETRSGQQTAGAMTAGPMTAGAMTGEPMTGGQMANGAVQRDESTTEEMTGDMTGELTKEMTGDMTGELTMSEVQVHG